MDTEAPRSCLWSESSPESSNSLKSPTKITSLLWKQLSEEQDLSEIHFPPFKDSVSEDNVSSNEYDASSNFLPSSKSWADWEAWAEFEAPTADVDADVGHLSTRNPWHSTSSTNQSSAGNFNYLESSLPSSDRHFGAIMEDFYWKNDKENTLPEFTKVVGNKGSYSDPFGKRDSISLTKDLVSPLQGLTNNVWTPSSKAPLGSSSQNSLPGGYSYGLGCNPVSGEPVHPPLRPPLRDIGNLSNTSSTGPQKMDNVHVTQMCNEFPSHQRPPPFSMAHQDFFYNQQAATSHFQAQKHPTDLVALMQELSVITNARGMSNLSYNTTTIPACSTSQKPPTTNPPMPLSNKGCVFCKNNNYHSTFYKSHLLKDERGHCQCPVLRMYVCPLCNATGDSAHTLKYCPRNTVTRGDPISAGLPPGKVTNWREVANRMMARYYSSK